MSVCNLKGFLIKNGVAEFLNSGVDKGDERVCSINNYSCELCDFISNKKTNYNIHIKTKKHMNKTLGLNLKKEYNCSNCNKCFINRSTLWYHKNKCNIINNDIGGVETRNYGVKDTRVCRRSGVEDVTETRNSGDYEGIERVCEFIVSAPSATPLRLQKPEPTKDDREEKMNMITIDKEIIMNLIIQSNEFKSLLIEQIKREKEEKKIREEREHEEKKELKNFFIENTNKMVEIAKNINTNNNNTITNSHNTTNNKFNLNFFLNEQCKNAINMSEFIHTVQVDLDDVTKVGTEGYVNGITNIIMNNLNKYDIYTRPIHCTDLKREVLHIREENKWNKETDNKTIKNCVEKIATKNCQKIAKWQEVYEESKKKDTPTYNLWLEIIGQSMNTGEKGERNTEKVIKNISKNVFLNSGGPRA